MNNLSEILQNLAGWFQTEIGVLVVALCTLLGLPLSLALAFLSRKIRAPRFMVRAVSLEWESPVGVFSPTLARAWAAKMRRRSTIRDQVAKLLPEASGKKLCLTAVAFWNAGGEPIRATDVASANPLRIVPREDHSILWARIAHISNPDNQFCVAFDDSTLRINFDYINRYDGVVLQLVHTGDSEALDIRGGFVEAGTPRRVRFGGVVDDSYWDRFTVAMFLLLALAVPLVANFAISIPEMVRTPWKSSYHYPIVESGIMGLCFLVVSVLSFPLRPAKGLRRAFEGSLEFSESEAGKRPTVLGEPSAIADTAGLTRSVERTSNAAAHR